MYLLVSILGILVTIFFVIGSHESAHFVTARLLGIKVLRFSIGFGRALWRWHDRSGTEYVIALIPLGGYVKMLDENEGPVETADLPLAFNRQPFYKKFLVVVAGPLINILSAILLYWLIFIIGFVSIRPIIGTVSPHSIAAEAGLKPKQEIIKVDHIATTGWPNVLFRVLTHVGNKDDMTITVKNPNNKFSEHTLDLLNWRMNDLNPDPLQSLGIAPLEPDIPLVIGIISEASPAAESALKLGDKIIAINEKPIQGWLPLVKFIYEHPEYKGNITIERNNKQLILPLKIGYHRSWLGKKTGYLGIAPKFKWPAHLTHKVKYSPGEAFTHAFQEVSDLTYFNLLLFEKLLIGKLSIQSLGGPITIFESAGDALNFGLVAFLGFLAFLSISIGVINLLPIPGLDGGHLVIYLVEFIIRRPIPLNVLMLLYRLGFILLFVVLIQAFINDIVRLF